MRARIATVLGVVLACGLWVGAAQAADTAGPSPKTLALAKRYIELSHLPDTMAGMLKSLIPAMLDQMSKGNPKATPEIKAAISGAVLEASPAMVQKLIDRAIPIYAETYSDEELEAIIAFVGSPAGQAMIAKAPLVTAKLTPAMIDIMPAFQADVLVRMCAKIDCTGMRPAAKPSAS